MDYVYPIITTPSEGGYLVTVPDLDINTEGNSVENALFMAKDAIGMWGISQQDLGREIPKCTDYKPVCGENDMVAWITIDFDDFRARQS